MIIRMDRSATPFSACTYGGQVVCAMRDSSRNSVNSRDRNSPALSVCKAPTAYLGSSLLREMSAFSDAT